MATSLDIAANIWQLAAPGSYLLVIKPLQAVNCPPIICRHLPLKEPQWMKQRHPRQRCLTTKTAKTANRQRLMSWSPKARSHGSHPNNSPSSPHPRNLNLKGNQAAEGREG